MRQYKVTSLCHCSSPYQVAMDHHRSHDRSSSYHNHQSAYRRDRDDSGRNQSEIKRSRPNHYHQQHQHQHQSGSAPWQTPLSSRGLSTRRELYERDFPVYKQPVEVGCFSLDSERRFFNDSRQMRYYVEPDRNPNFDLRDGYKDRFVKRDDSVKEKLDHMLRWIVANKAKIDSKEAAASSR